MAPKTFYQNPLDSLKFFKLSAITIATIVADTLFLQALPINVQL